MVLIPERQLNLTFVAFRREKAPRRTGRLGIQSLSFQQHQTSCTFGGPACVPLEHRACRSSHVQYLRPRLGPNLVLENLARYVMVATGAHSPVVSGSAKDIMPSGSISGTPPTLVLTMYRPQQAASRMPIPKASVRDAFRKICPCTRNCR
jgi:hypothetical protein